MTKLKDMKRSNPRGVERYIKRFNQVLASEKGKRWALIFLAAFIVFLMVFSGFMAMFR